MRSFYDIKQKITIIKLAWEVYKDYICSRQIQHSRRTHKIAMEIDAKA